MRRFALILSAIAGQASAQDWQPLTGPQISQALTGRALVYESGARQDFRVSGRTLYEASEPSWGYWAVRGDQYCSKWPPSDLWACYDVAGNADQIRFVGASGDTTDGTFAK